MELDQGISRRQVTKGVAWSIPVIASAVATPAKAASVLACTTDNTISAIGDLLFQVDVIDTQNATVTISNENSTLCWAPGSAGVTIRASNNETIVHPLLPGAFVLNGVAGANKLDRPSRTYSLRYDFTTLGPIKPGESLVLAWVTSGTSMFSDQVSPNYPTVTPQSANMLVLADPGTGTLTSVTVNPQGSNHIDFSTTL
ncbi:MAG: hypothetical protein QM632_07015 [Micrococcaceae bacterium]